MTDFLQGALAKRDPSLAPPPEARGGEASDEAAAAAAAPPPGAFATLADVDAALGAALGYFAASEPSSPALLLIGQARETLGKNLYDVMKLLAPAHADAARVFVGPDGAFTVPVSGLSSAPSAEFARADAAPAPSRAAALALIDGVASHMRRVEPSSPAPYLLDRARALALARLPQPAARRAARGRSRLDEERALSRYLPTSVRNVVQSGESSVSISAKLTACSPRRQQSDNAEDLELAAVDAHRNRALQHVGGVDVGRVEIDVAALQRPLDRRRARAGRHRPPAFGRKLGAGVRADREIDQHPRLVADAKVGADRRERPGEGDEREQRPPGAERRHDKNSARRIAGAKLRSRSRFLGVILPAV